MNHLSKLIALSTILSLCTACSKQHSVPGYLNNYKSEYQADPRAANLQWFKDAKYGMFIHYGLYSLLEKGEWIQLRDTIPVSEYAKLKDRFTAAAFDADKITDMERKRKKIREIKELIDQVHSKEIQFLKEQATLLASQDSFSGAYKELEKALTIASTIDKEELKEEEIKKKC